MKKLHLISLIFSCFLFGCEKEPILTIQLEEIKISSTGENKTITFTTNKDWTATVNGGSWISLSNPIGKAGDVTLTLIIAANDSYDDRSATVTISAGELKKTLTISQSKKKAIIILNKRYDISTDGGEIKIELNSNLDYEVVIPTGNQSWIIRNQTKGLSANNLYFNISANTSYDNRTGRIIIKEKTSSFSDTVFVYQSQKDAIILSQKNYDITDSSKTITIELKSNIDYSVIIPPDFQSWVFQLPTKSLTTHNIQFFIRENTLFTNRSSHVVFIHPSKNISDTLRITQNRAPSIPVLTTSTSLYIDASSILSGGTITDRGGAEITEKGVCWSTEPLPTTQNNKVISQTNSLDFSCLIQNLTHGQRYYVRSFATNRAGTNYGEVVELINEVKRIRVINPINEIKISRSHDLQANVEFETGNAVNPSNLQLSVRDGRLNISNKKIIGVKSGDTYLSFIYKGVKDSIKIYVNPVEEVSIDPALRTSNGKLRIPVVIIRFLPTVDGINLDVKNAPDSYWNYNYPSLDLVRQKWNDDNTITKSAVEYATRFRDYGTQKVEPYIYIDVIKQFDIYEYDFIPYNINAEAQKTLDFHKIFQKINLEDLVNNHGVKEVWVNFYQKSNMQSVIKNGDDDWSTYWNIFESNMSSPTGDMSNSDRNNNDLPVYNSTYVVYAHFGQGSVDLNLHNRGHQFEAQIYHLDKTHITKYQNKYLFSNLFVGSGNAPDDRPLGRVGLTHFVPNSTVDYDYANMTKVESDIMDWIPSGGKKTLVNADTWFKIKYPFSLQSRFTQLCGGIPCVVDFDNDYHVKWMLFWYQSIPGVNNNIPFEYNGKVNTLHNWWDLFYNWDDAIRNKKTLWY